LSPGENATGIQWTYGPTRRGNHVQCVFREDEQVTTISIVRLNRDLNPNQKSRGGRTKTNSERHSGWL
jgi:hypothetical protein